MELSDSRLIGVFLTVATFGADDSPDHAGWIIASDPNGGTSNYIERHVLDANRGVEISWALSAPMDESSHTFHIGVHHGGDGIARLASTEDSGGIDIDVGPIPENFPQVDESWEPPTMRGLGEETMIETVLLNVTNAQLEWRISGSLQTNIIEATQENNVWNASLPAALGPVIIEYRWLLSNEDHDTTTAWTTLSAEEISSIDVNPARILMIKLAMSTAGLLIGIQRRLAVSLADSETFEYPPKRFHKEVICDGFSCCFPCDFHGTSHRFVCCIYFRDPGLFSVLQSSLVFHYVSNRDLVLPSTQRHTSLQSLGCSPSLRQLSQATRHLNQ